MHKLNLKNQKILITGVAGYIGSVLLRLLLNEKIEVVGIDQLFFNDRSIKPELKNPLFKFYEADIRDSKKMQEIIEKEKPNAIVHLAAIVGDAACLKEQEMAKDINLKASKQLVDLADDLEVPRFIFSSTCSNYGKIKYNEMVDENSQLVPLSLYAETKVAFENYLLSKEYHNTSPCILRFSSVFGKSPRMRFDLTVNEFTRELHFGNELEIYGPQFWRPYCHVEDLATSVLFTLQASKSLISKKVYNVGNNDENFQKQDLVNKFQQVFPNSKISFIDKKEDTRSYRVNFDKINNALGFQTIKNVEYGIRELKEMLEAKEISNPYDKVYCNS